MFWRTLFIAAFVVGALCEKLTLSDTKRTQLHNFLESKCEKQGAKNKTDQVEQAVYNFIDCVMEHEDTSVLKEITDADDEVSIINVFKRVCSKVPAFKSCFYTFLDNSLVCMTTGAKENIDKAKKLIDDINEFACGNDAAKFSEFVYDGSIQCIDEKVEDLDKCTKKIKLDESDSSSSSEENSEDLKENCQQFDELRECIKNVLSTCPKPTAGTFINDLFVMVRKASLCNEQKSISDNEV